LRSSFTDALVERCFTLLVFLIVFLNFFSPPVFSSVYTRVAALRTLCL
jgi:hypothetical protein